MVAILVILTIFTFVMIDVVLQYSRARRRKLQVGQTARRVPIMTAEGISLPRGIYVSPGHTWVSIDAEGRTTVGMDDFVGKAVGRIDGVTLPQVGQKMREGDTLFRLRQGERSISIPAPVEGEIIEVNQVLERDPSAMKLDPYDDGWICRIAPRNLAHNLKSIPIAEEAADWINAEVQRFRDFVTARPLQDLAAGAVMQDGGVPADGALELMDNETWFMFEQQFLRY